MALTSGRMAKIVCTLGPSSSSEDKVRELTRNGMNVVRLNFSHGDHETHRANVEMIRRISREEHSHLAILQDLQGPKIRLGMLPDDGVLLQEQQQVMLAPSSYQLPWEEALPVSYDYLCEDVKVGDDILLSDGKLELSVERIEKDRIVAKVIHGGQIFSRKGVNLPSSDLRISSFTEKDMADLKFGLELKVDFVALSFIRHEKDLEPVYDLMKDVPFPPRLIAKIEKPQAVERFEHILENVDAIMVARGDLGVELPIEKLPKIQKNLIAQTLAKGKNVITATQMLLSMVQNPTPTRAEVSDVANAIYDGSSAVMLSDETAAGKYPVEACAVMEKIATAAQNAGPNLLAQQPADIFGENYTIAIGRSACVLAADLKADAILTFTVSGRVTRAVVRFRPNCPVIALTPYEQVACQLNLSWGVIPGVIEMVNTLEKLQDKALDWLRRHHLYRRGHRIVVTAGVPLGQSDRTNLLEVIEL